MSAELRGYILDAVEGLRLWAYLLWVGFWLTVQAAGPYLLAYWALERISR